MVTSRILFTAKPRGVDFGSAGRTEQSVLAISRALERERQDRRPADRGSQWRDRSSAALQSCGGIEA